jgi:hypothetical protein
MYSNYVLRWSVWPTKQIPEFSLVLQNVLIPSTFPVQWVHWNTLPGIKVSEKQSRTDGWEMKHHANNSFGPKAHFIIQAHLSLLWSLSMDHESLHHQEETIACPYLMMILKHARVQKQLKTCTNTFLFSTLFSCTLI